MDSTLGLKSHCVCWTPLVYSARLNAHICTKCWKAYRFGKVVPLAKVSKVLDALVENHDLTAKRRKLPVHDPAACCAMGPKYCSGPAQRHHLVGRQYRPDHPLLHHPDNLVYLCRHHHRQLERIANRHDFAGSPQRDDIPPGGYGNLSLVYARWVVQHIRPNLRVKALGLGLLLWGRLQDRQIDDQAPTPVSLYYRWLYRIVGNAEGIRAFAGIIYGFDPEGYDYPLFPQDPGTCRTYHLRPVVVTALARGPHLEVGVEELRFVLAALLDEMGETYRAIAPQLKQPQQPIPSLPTVYRWVKKGRALMKKAKVPTSTV